LKNANASEDCREKTIEKTILRGPRERTFLHSLGQTRSCRDVRVTGFWHETYFMRGGIEAIFDDMPKPIDLMRFAPRRAAKGGMFTARQRAAATNAAAFAYGQAPPPVVAEDEVDGGT
jgi:hypothetical protein